MPKMFVFFCTPLRLAPRLCAALLCFMVSTPTWAWWHCDWKQRVKVTLPASVDAGKLVELLLPKDEIKNLLGGYTATNNDLSLRVVADDNSTEIPFYLDKIAEQNAKNIRLWIKPNARTSSFYIYVNNTNVGASNTQSSLNVFNNLTTAPNSLSEGLRYHTRKRGARNTSLKDFLDRFDDTADNDSNYGCKRLTLANRIENSYHFGSNQNILTAITFILNVPADEVGSWGIRMGPDFGDGGAIYIDGDVVDDKWGQNLWWNLWWPAWWGSNPAVISGTKYLSAGAHLVTIYGSEICCDGRGEIQLRKPNGNWQLLSITNFNIIAPSCNKNDTAIPPSPSIEAAPATPKMTVSKTASTIYDPINGSTNPRAISGAKVRYTIAVKKTGKGNPTDLSIVDTIPSNTTFVGANISSITNPVPSSTTPQILGPIMWWTDNSNLTLSSNDIAYSTAAGGGTPFTSTMPTGTNATTGANPNVKGIKIEPKGSYNPACSPAKNPKRFFIEFDVLVN